MDNLADDWESIPSQAATKSNLPLSSDWDNVAAPVKGKLQQAPTLLQQATNLGAGAIRGAGSIGSTILYPWDKAQDLIYGDRNQAGVNGQMPLSRNDERRQGIDAGLTALTGSDPNSLPYKVGKVGTEVMGTLGVGGVAGKTAEAAGYAPEIVNALRSGGMSLGGATAGSTAANIGTKVAAGALIGGASAGLVDPNSVSTGSAIGAITPGGAWLLGMAGNKIANAVGTTAKSALGMTTGTGADTVGAAYHAGASADRSFLENMRGNTSMGDVVDQAKTALANMRAQRGAQYRAGMDGVTSDKTVLDIAPIQKAVAGAPDGLFNGKVVNPDVVAKVQAIKDKVAEWAGADPNVFHTPEGLDQLKQSIGAIREQTQPGTAARTAADQVYNSVKNQISQQAPKYADVMEHYSNASDQLNEITKSLSLGNKASTDTALRKLQSVLRNNVNSNFGNRTASVQALQDQGGANLLPGLAGQSMNSWTPRGMAGIFDGIAAIPAYLHNPALLAGGLAASPRLVGEAAYTAGRALSGTTNALKNIGSQPLSSIAPVIGTQKMNYLSDLTNATLLMQNQSLGARPVKKP